MHTWLKSIGSAQQPITDRYTDLSVGFRKKSTPGIRKGDHLFLYAPGGSKRIFALAEATDNPERDIKYNPEIEGSCRWKLSVRYLINLPVVDGVHLDEVRGKRHLAGSIRQQSHINLRPEESQSARKLLESQSAYRKNTKNMSGTPLAIRVLPVSREDPEIDSYPDVGALQQGFFLEKFRNRARDGRFHYKTKGLQTEPGTLVLFQFEREIIASAIFVKGLRQSIKEGGTLYKGVLYFDVDSIRVFDPVPWETVRRIWPNAKSPSHVKYDLEPSRYTEFERELHNIRPIDESTLSADELHDELTQRRERVIQAFARDSKMVREIKELYENRCQVCGERLEIQPGEFYAEAHHLQPLGGEHKGPDVKDNILCLCPNHHVLFDYFAISLDPAKLRLNKHNLRKSFVDYHNAHFGKLSSQQRLH